MTPSTKPVYVTTSWDDGHPHDLQVAELLAKHGLRATFYIPRRTERDTMTPSEIRTLSNCFEVGAHTLNHVDLSRSNPRDATQEIVDSRQWIESITDERCSMFCFPMGKFSDAHIPMVRDAGYLGARTVELLSLDFPVETDGLWLMPTTVQAYPHRSATYVKNAVKRRSLDGLWRFVRYGIKSDWTLILNLGWKEVVSKGGVLHLWGHSWELEEPQQWHRLEQVIEFLGNQCVDGQIMTNGEICEASSTAASSV